MFKGDRSDNEIVKAKKKVVREAFGSGSDSEGSVKREEDSQANIRKRRRLGSAVGSGSGNSSEGRYFKAP